MKKTGTPIQKKEVKQTTKSNRTGLKVTAGILAGAAAGALAGVLLAPKSGKATRKTIADKSKKAAMELKEKVTQKVKTISKKKETGNDKAKPAIKGAN